MYKILHKMEPPGFGIPISPFEKNAVLKAYKCSSCNRIYSTQVHANTIGGRIPLLMPCSHTICEECLIKMAKTKNISCKVCQYEMLMENTETYFDFFPVDRFMFGSLMNLNLETLKKTSPRSDQKVSVVPFLPAGSNISKKTKHNFNRKDTSFEEGDTCSQKGCTKRAEFRCNSCREIYCIKCDKRVHESIRILRFHKRYPIDIADFSDFTVSCKVHEDIIGEYSCTTCGFMLCTKCVMKDHYGHSVISVEDKNEQELVSFKETLRKAKSVLKSMEYTQKKVKLELTSASRPASTLESDIIRHFSSLHSRLQLLEQSILMELSKAQNARANSLMRLSTELASNIDTMSNLVSTGNSVVEGGKENMEKLLLSELERSIKENLMLPCELEEDADKKIDNVRFVVDESFMETLQNHCRVELDEGSSLKLIPLTDFSDRTFELLSDDEVTSSESESVRSRAESESSATSQISYVKPGCKTRLCLAKNSPTQVVGETSHSMQREKVKKPNEPIVFVKGTTESVIITHLTNPSHFYVQLSRKRKEIEEMTNKYELYAEHAVSATSPEIGNTYIVQFVTEKMKKWYRGTVKDIHATGLTTLYEVFFIDYGNTAIVPISKIKEMKPAFMQKPPYAYKCRLAGIISQKNDWPDAVMIYILKFITPGIDPPMHPVRLHHFLIYENRNNHLKMLVKENQKGILDVDLLSHNQSLSDALIFMGYASSMADKTKRKANLVTETKIASTIDNYAKDHIYQINVTNVINPSCIYIQLFDNTKIISNIETAMTRYYEKSENNLVFIPEKGMVCVAKLEASKGKWWRVEITSLPGNQSVEVFALDYGLTEIVPWSQLRKIKDMHKQTDAQAVKVSLSDIAPPIGAGNVWPDETTEFLREYLKNKSLSMYVNNTTKQELLVTIYERTEETDICIDALLVRKELAESTGESSLLVEFHKALPEEIDSTTIITAPKQLPNDIKAPKPDKNNLLLMDSKSYAAGIKIIKVNSPSSFYVDIPDWYDEKVKMIKQMALYYSDKISPCKKWELNNKCVVHSSDDKYYRAIVTKVLEDNTYELFIKDFVRNEIVPTRRIFELDEIFATHDYSLHCRLGGMKPAGGSEKWPARALDIFQEFIDQYDRLYISKYGPSEDKILSVQLFTQWEERAGPLEPTKIQRIVLNDKLLESGVAFPVKVECFRLRSTSPFESENKLPKKKIVEDSCYESDLAPFSRLLEGNQAVPIDNVLSSSNTSKPTNWLPPSRINDKHFNATATYVDFEGAIYFQTPKGKRLLKNVIRILEKHFKNSKPDPPHPWEIGQMCTVLYHLDNNYYRGTIVDITGEKIIVKFIDYGNQEEVTHEELRSEVIATDIPTLCFKCKLSNVVPQTDDGSWSLPVLDRLHVTLVENDCEIVIDENTDEYVDDIYAIIYLNGECINNLINSTQWNTEITKAPSLKPSDDEDVVIEDEIFSDVDVDIENEEIFEEIFERKHEYTYVQLPADKNSFKVVVINIIDYRTIIIEADFAMDIISSTRDQFNEMSLEITSEGADQPRVAIPIVGMPCIALFGQDNQWYRAEILEIMDSRAQEIKVLFIDFGNVEIMPIEDIRVIKSKWLEYPVSMLKFKIWGIVKHPDFDLGDVTTAMREAVVDKQTICQVQKREPDVEVKLIDEETYEVLYKQLLDENMIQSID